MRLIAILLFSTCFALHSNSLIQESATAPARTPEQEATLQTQKMQKELRLNKEQAQAIYEINLKHARERQVSNSRSQALERIRIKDNEIKKALTPDQYNRLQDKRYEQYPSRAINDKNYTTHPSTNPLLKRRTHPSSEQRSINPSIQRSIAPRQSPSNGRSTTQPGRRVSPTSPSVMRTTPSNIRSSSGRPSSTQSSNNERTQKR